MCTDPQIFDGYEVSCRECDQCVATYKNTWVARCVAEKQTLPYAYSFTLTYADQTCPETGEVTTPLGAKVFRYKDVSNMWKRIRAAGKRRWGENIELRYVCVGEKGTKYGRCHYHGVFFSNYPIVELGTLTHPKGNKFAYKRRLNWSIWGHGFVEFQPADRKGMSYALKYILKARMTAKRSEGHKREGKTEWLASSYLWCSKVPPVGGVWLFQKLNELVSVGLCPSALRIRVPGGGDWWVMGKLQMEMCLFLHHANNEYRKERGRDLAGWKTLIASCEEEIENLKSGELVKRKTWEWLVNGEQEEEITELTPKEIEQSWTDLQEWFRYKRKIAEPINNARATVRLCGNIKPCEACATDLAEHDHADLEQEYNLRYEEWCWLEGRNQHNETNHERFKRWWQTRLRPSRGCALRNTEILKEQFGRLISVTKAQRGLKGKGAVGKALRRQGPTRQ